MIVIQVKLYDYRCKIFKYGPSPGRRYPPPPPNDRYLIRRLRDRVVVRLTVMIRIRIIVSIDVSKVLGVRVRL